MPRYKLTIEYDGGPFSGWQYQDDQPTVQGELMRAAKALDQSDVTVYGSGRTDAGVHALAQIAHMDLMKDLDPLTVRDALNHHLKPHPISVLEVKRADGEFHARFLANERRYLYRILHRRAPPTVDIGKVWHIPYRLDVAAMHEASQALIGQHDFTTFRDTRCQAKSPVKTLTDISVTQVLDEIHIHISARSFLHKQVRSMTGTLVEVGRGRLPVSGVEKALKAADRDACGPVAPPDGLYLVSVSYPN